MELTREEAIRNYREHWASLAISGSDNKRDYLDRNGYPKMRDNCFLCEYTKRTCKDCPIEWPNTTGHKGIFPCCNSYFDNWVNATTPDERKRLAAIIRDLPEKKIEAPKPEPKFKKGDKVFPVSKTVPTFGCPLDKDAMWRECKEHGYFYVVNIDEVLTRQYGKVVYGCSATPNDILGNVFFESDLRPYVEPETKKEPEGFKVGDRVVFRGHPATIRHIDNSDIPYAVEFDERLGYSNIPNCKDGYGHWAYGSSLELLPSINLCPEPKTLTESKTITFEGNKTTCTIEIDGRKFTGVAKCDPNVKWDGEIGRQYAELRANRKMLDAVEKELRRG